VTRTLAGVFGRGAESAGATVRGSLDHDVSDVLATRALTVGWTGGPRGQGTTTLLLSGGVRNLQALASELGTASGGDTEQMLLVGHERWGDELPSRLRGTFVLVVWNPASRTGLLAVDQLGAGALFLHESGERLSFATELRNLVRLLPTRPAPSASSVVQWLADGHLRVGDTLYSGIRRLESGHVVRLEDERWRTESYWAPSYRSPDPLTRTEAVAQIETALRTAVRARMAHGETTGVLLSGGLDSATVATIASRLDPAPGPLKAFSHVYPDNPDLDESRLAGLVTKALDLPWERMAAPSVGTLPSALEYQLVWEVPAATPMLAFTQPLLHLAAAEGVAVMLDGEGGDELFGYSPYLIADRLRHGRLREAVDLLRRTPDTGASRSFRALSAHALELGFKGSAPYGFHRILRRIAGRRYAASWLTAEGAKAYVETRDDWSWKRRAGPRWWAYLADLLTTWREQMSVHDFFRARDAFAGLETRHPLLDDLDLIELVLRLPPQLSFDPVLTRPLERDVVAGVLPDEIRLRRDKSTFSDLVVEAMGGPDYNIVAELLGARDAEIWSYAQPDPLRKLLEVPAERRSIAWARLLWRLATTETWLRAQADPDFPARLLQRHAQAISGAQLAPRVPRRARTS
jgi:asparagine synthase (glutamine-hydrolysing)